VNGVARRTRAKGGGPRAAQHGLGAAGAPQGRKPAHGQVAERRCRRRAIASPPAPDREGAACWDAAAHPASRRLRLTLVPGEPAAAWTWGPNQAEAGRATRWLGRRRDRCSLSLLQGRHAVGRRPGPCCVASTRAQRPVQVRSRTGWPWGGSGGRGRGRDGVARGVEQDQKKKNAPANRVCGQGPVFFSLSSLLFSHRDTRVRVPPPTHAHTHILASPHACACLAYSPTHTRGTPLTHARRTTHALFAGP
jgi:hypothetical protein